MARKKKDPDAVLKESPAFKRFEEATKAILKAPKAKVDKRLAEERHSTERQSKGKS
jgi:hypothetical protein